MDKKVLVIGLDGFPYTLARRLISEGLMPNLSSLLEEGELVQMNSVYPTVSGVAWSSFQTGQNPGKFGVYGFSDLDHHLNLFVPDSSHLRSKTIMEIASEHGKAVISVGVPNTYPPRHVKGIMVGDFISPSLEKAVYPPSALAKMQRDGYIMDISPMKARESLEYFKAENTKVFEGRLRTLFDLWRSEPWDLFIFHFMDTDRVNHFLFKFWDSDESQNLNKKYFIDFYRRIDDMLGTIKAKLADDIQLIILSDHGFCRLEREVQINRWLQVNGFLSFRRRPRDELDFEAVSPDSKAIALVPGRIYILTVARWAQGRVRESEREGIRNAIISRLGRLEFNGRKVCRKVHKREEVFSGPYAEAAPDIIIDPEDGFDLKAGLKKDDIFENGPISGMHTYSDALLYIRGVREYVKRPVIWDVMPTILRMLRLPIPRDLDGISLIKE